MKYTACSSEDVVVYQDHYIKSAKVGKFKKDRNAGGDDVWYCNHESIGEYCIGDMWLHVSMVNDRPLNGWLPIVHLGRRMCELESDEPYEPPPPPEPIPPDKKVARVDVVFDDNSIESLYPR